MKNKRTVEEVVNGIKVLAARLDFIVDPPVVDAIRRQGEVVEIPNIDEAVQRLRLLVRDEGTGAVDLVVDPANPEILYASLWEVSRTPHSLSSGGPGSGLYRNVWLVKTPPVRIPPRRCRRMSRSTRRRRVSTSGLSSPRHSDCAACRRAATATPRRVACCSPRSSASAAGICATWRR